MGVSSSLAALADPDASSGSSAAAASVAEDDNDDNDDGDGDGAAAVVGSCTSGSREMRKRNPTDCIMAVIRNVNPNP